MNLLNLLNNTVIDKEKRAILTGIRQDIISEKLCFDENYDNLCDLDEIYNVKLSKVNIPNEKVCPECNTKFHESENFCPNCSVKLIKINKINIIDLEIPIKTNRTCINLNQIFTSDNITRLSDFDFTKNDLDRITKALKSSSVKTLDNALKSNGINFDNLFIKDKILIYVKSFLPVIYKSSGPELGFYEFGRISIDDRQSNVLQTTTLIHELAHFLLAEIMAEILAKVLNLKNCPQIKAITHYILNYDDFTKLLDEYCAHTVESRFTLFGFQDYSSFKNLLKNSNLTQEYINLAKLIGNSYANLIIQILESVINPDLREEIKNEFINDYMTPSYEDLKFETCHMLNDEGLIESFKYILNSGFENAFNNQDKIDEYSKNFL